jgi:hypothetical protein
VFAIDNPPPGYTKSAVGQTLLFSITSSCEIFEKLLFKNTIKCGISMIILRNISSSHHALDYWPGGENNR